MGNSFLYSAALGSLREIFQVSEGWTNVEKIMIGIACEKVKKQN